MADGAYERRGPREAEMARFERIIRDARAKASDSVRKADVEPVHEAEDAPEGESGKKAE